MTLAQQFTRWTHGLSDPDAGLLDRARKGQQSAFDTLICRYETLLRGFIARRVGAQEVDDVLQETRIACWSSLPQYASRARFKAWLFGIASHKCADYHRNRGQAARQETELPLDYPEKTSAFEAIELHAAVQDILGRLPNAQREVLELYYYAELTLPEIAAALERNLNTVKYQFYRAHTQAAQELRTEAIPTS